MASELRVDKIIPTAGVPTGGGGGIVQTVQTVKTDALNIKEQEELIQSNSCRHNR